MTLRTIWSRKAEASLKEPELSDFQKALAYAKTCEHANDRHVRVHFNDNTSYTLCQRYLGRFAAAIGPEMMRCAMVSLPTSDPIAVEPDAIAAEVDDKLCDECGKILHATIFGGERQTRLRLSIENKLAWRDVYTGEFTPVRDEFTLDKVQ